MRRIDLWGLDMVFVVGGNGGNAAADAIQQEVQRQGVRCVVAGVPKSIDNDILLVSKLGPSLQACRVPVQVAKSCTAHAASCAAYVYTGAVDRHSLVHTTERARCCASAAGLTACTDNAQQATARCVPRRRVALTSLQLCWLLCHLPKTCLRGTPLLPTVLCCMHSRCFRCPPVVPVLCPGGQVLRL